ncbi:hypothetical protein FOCC_FOCC001550 [Frankliniella occidentalis]|uniref:DNA excision repair protein ERCC-1 n=1 Tax=Frankliniella occidentalis TaxID=133901 RepID=A0A6J1T3L7_FRAOC|nr:DNA excision repair protein ERCC-1 [Frankliniella occidentalis]KAE8751702.1 hypothetical protein FOCC_FOCC001550 [Frankliniella occidentalis]
MSESQEGSPSKGEGPSTSKAHASHALLVSPKQKGNPALKAVSNIPWEFDESILADYVMGPSSCALFLSIRYHNLNPDYIHDRLKVLGNKYELRVLLVQVDSPDPHHALKHLTRICILANLTLVLAWSAEEAGRILETYKIFEHKPPDLIMERSDSDPHSKLVNALTSIRSINKTDAATLLSTFGSLKKLATTSKDTLSLCPGLGPQKATRLYNVLHQPFLKDKSSKASKSKPQASTSKS